MLLMLLLVLLLLLLMLLLLLSIIIRLMLLLLLCRIPLALSIPPKRRRCPIRAPPRIRGRIRPPSRRRSGQCRRPTPIPRR